MPRPYNNKFIQTHDNLLIGTADTRALNRQVKKLAIKQEQLEKRRKRLAFLLKQSEAQLEMINAAMGNMKPQS